MWMRLSTQRQDRLWSATELANHAREKLRRMTTLNIQGIIWEANGVIGGKATFAHRQVRVVWDPKLGIFQVKNGNEMLFAREERAEALRAATTCILEAYANQLVPSWECASHGEEAQEAPRRTATLRGFGAIRREA